MTGKYTPLRSGFRELSQSAWMKAVTLEVAQRMSGNANAVGDSQYKAESRTVRVGKGNEPRAGAAVSETQKHWKDSRDAVLLRVASAMRVRGQR